jgi:hypothetical protein
VTLPRRGRTLDAMARGLLHPAPALHAAAVPRAPRPVPVRAVVREFLLPLATGLAWMAVGAIALAVARFEGLPPPERATFGVGLAWMVGLCLVAAGGIVFSWALVRSTWWSRLQRHGRAADAVVTRVAAVPWLRIAGRAPLDLELAFADAGGAPRELRVRLRPTWRRGAVAAGDALVVIHSPGRPEQAALYWKG